MQKIVSSAQMRRIDENAIKSIGVPGVVLMENAGIQVVNQIQKFCDGAFPEHIVIICGKGNNGGDGFVIARHLAGKDVDTSIVLLGDADNLKGDARTNWNICVKSGIDVQEFTEKDESSRIFDLIFDADLIIDAIFGTGLSSPVKGFYEDIINLIDESEIPVVSVDIPSGLSSDTGAIIGSAINAELTVTFGLPKIGTILFPAAGYCGRLEVVDIGIPQVVELEADYTALMLEEQDFVGILGHRDRNAHKGTFGHLLVIGGSPGKTGAAAMCAQAGLRLGTGLVTAAIPESLNTIMEMKLTEVMTLPLPETKDQTIAAAALDPIMEFCYRIRALALGPGISTQPETAETVRNLLVQCPVPVVLDADGINALAGHLDILSKRTVPTIITPHPGEMARLMDTSITQIQENRITVANEFAKKYQTIVVLKGARTVIAEPSGRVYINPTGNPGMASGGTGDILTGIIAGALTLGLDPIDAANLGVYLHGLTADLASEELGEASLTAMDIHDFLPESILKMNLELVY